MADGGSSHIENDFVQELQCVTQEHQRHDVEVDAAAQGRHVDGTNSYSISMVVKILPSCVNLARDVIGGPGFSDVDFIFWISRMGAVLV